MVLLRGLRPFSLGKSLSIAIGFYRRGTPRCGIEAAVEAAIDHHCNDRLRLRIDARGLAGTPRHVFEQRRKSVKVLLARRGLAPGKTDVTLRLWCREMQQANIAPLMQLARHCHFRQERNAMTMCDHLHNGGETRRAEGLSRLWRHHAAKRERLIAQAMPLLKQQQPLLR